MMKNLFLSLLAAIVTAIMVTAPSLVHAASYSAVFLLDEQALDEEFAQLNVLESYVLSHEGVTASAIGTELPASLVPAGFQATNGISNVNFSVDDMDWGSFAWGFCCWPVGLFVVVLNKNKDSDQKLSYFIGIVTGLVLGGISTGVYYGGML